MTEEEIRNLKVRVSNLEQLLKYVIENTQPFITALESNDPCDSSVNLEDWYFITCDVLKIKSKWKRED